MLKYIYTLLILGLFGLASCVQDETPTNINPGPKAEDGYLQIHMNLPELKSQQAGEPSTRAMNDQAERMIKLDQLNVLVFKEEAGVEKYAYKAPLSGAVEYDSEDGTKARITVKLARSTGSEKYRLVLVANYDLSGVTLSANETKAVVLEKLTYNIAGKWNADASNYTPFPMWGESDLVTISAEMSGPSINMYRALARIDVGFNFTTTGTTLNESAEGDINHFNIKEVKVYRTYNQGYAAPTNSDITAAPFIPSTATRRADTAPLEYSVTGGTNSYVREIYIPEANLPATPANDNMHCIIVGGSYKGSSNITYYRLDFATETNPEGVRTYLPVFRNHRYVFNITQVRGPGFTTPQAALESTATIENINYDLIKWDETIHKMEVQGKYYFGLDKRNLLFNQQPNESQTIKYQTNLSSTVTYEWKNGAAASAFEITNINNATKELTIRTKSENVTNTVIVDTLFVKAGSFTIPVHVEQLYVNFKYTINCETVTVHGNYVNGESLNLINNQITLTITAEDETILGKDYILETQDLEGNHGIQFSGSGKFTSLTQNIILTGSGTLRNNSDEGPFKLRIKSNSSSGSYCEATISPVSGILEIITLGNMDAHGYNIAYTSGGAHKLLTAPSNFGTDNSSMVKVQGFNFTNTLYYDLSVYTNTDAYKLITGANGKLADMVYICYPMHVPLVNAAATAQILIDYMEKGGVVVAFIDYNGLGNYLGLELTKKLLNKSDITVNNSGAGGSVYPFPAHPIYVDHLDNEQTFEIFNRYQGDPILNGPFGDVRDKQWGEDAGITVNLQNMPLDDPNLTIYSYYTNIAASGAAIHSQDVNAYKYESESSNMVYFGDGGFTSAPSGIPTPSLTLYPFYWNTSTLTPIPKPNFGTPKSWEVYNSVVFCNIMAWAINKSQSLKSKRESNQ